MRKNVAGQVVGAQMTTAADGTAFTGAVTVSVTGDGGTQATGSVGSGACAHEGKGFHTYAPAQAETNYDHAAFTFEGTGAITVTVQLYPAFPQTGDTFARLGAPAGASVSADIAAIEAQTDDIGTAGAGLTAVPWNAAWDAEVQSEVADALAVYDPPTKAELDSAVAPLALEATAQSILTDTVEIGTAGAGLTNINLPNQTMDIVGNITGNLSGSVGSVTGAVGSVTGNVGGNVAGSVASVTAGVTLAAAAVQAIWDVLTSALTTVGSIGKLLVDNINATISSRLASASYTAPLDASSTRSAVGLGSANLDTQLGDLPTNAELATALDPLPTAAEIRAEIDSNSTKLSVAVSTRAAAGDAMALTSGERNSVADALLARALAAESYAADGAVPTLSQALWMIWAGLADFSITGTTLTVKKQDGTAAMTFTLDSSSAPTSRTRAT